MGTIRIQSMNMVKVLKYRGNRSKVNNIMVVELHVQYLCHVGHN